MRPVEAGCGRRGRPSEAAAGKTVEEAAEEEMKKATKGDREPSANTGEWPSTERWAEEEERRKEEVKETRRVTKRRRDGGGVRVGADETGGDTATRGGRRPREES